MVTEVLHFERTYDSTISPLPRRKSWELLKSHCLVEGDMPKDEFTHYRLKRGVSARDLDLRRVDLSRAIIEEVDFGDTNLDGAAFRHTVFVNCHLVGTSVFGANFGGAQMIETTCIALKYNTRSHIEKPLLGSIVLDILPFFEKHIKGRSRAWSWLAAFLARFCYLKDQDPAKRKTIVTNLDVRASRNSLFERYVADENYLTAFKDVPRHFYPYLLWKLTCDCGRSFSLWLLWSLVISLAFGLAYFLFPGLIYVNPLPGRSVTFVTYVYFSIVTFTTLGFGDITPLSPMGELLVILEVFSGYVMLGGLISIFANRLSRRA